MLCINLECSVISVEACDVVADCEVTDWSVWMHGVFIVWNLLEDMAQLQPWPCSLAYSYGVKAVCVGLNLCSKTVSWADVLFAYSCTATLTSLLKKENWEVWNFWQVWNLCVSTVNSLFQPSVSSTLVLSVTPIKRSLAKLHTSDWPS